jgi:hypothetical protein
VKFPFLSGKEPGEDRMGKPVIFPWMLTGEKGRTVQIAQGTRIGCVLCRENPIGGGGG